ncbi:hypothetical protein [Paracoccus marinaquae]|uniref:Uncharacterized protein n=1 Tax=Paracoccus marinaquae TaxID=2841926 RepID=A0ABS6AGX6_9RHOB|nr:hypothetical protein [Paracoccus marinaquae]MBU3029836.1 hypothetical protein [Paracoccus marinaquae]
MRPILPTLALMTCLATPAPAWELYRLTDDYAATGNTAGEYVVNISCVRDRGTLYLSIAPFGMDRSAVDGLTKVSMQITLPDGRSEQVEVALTPERDSFDGPFPVRADWLAAFKDGREMRVSRTDTGLELFRSDMKGTGAARLLFAERCGI